MNETLKRLTDCRLYTFVDTAYLAGRSPADIARQLCDGGSDILQVRAKDRPETQVGRLAETIKDITDRAGIPLVVNDYVSVARDVGAAFCHLGQEDFFAAGHQQIAELMKVGDDLGIGLSSHSPGQAERAVRAGAHYLGVGPVYATGTKPSAQPVTLEYVRWAAAHLTVPWFAIGGITLANVADVWAAGARRICVVSAILKAANVVKACQEFRKRLASFA